MTLSTQSVGVVSSHTQLAKSSLAGYSAGNDIEQEFGLWGQIFGSTATQDDRDGESGYDATTYGLVFGYDVLNKYDDHKNNIKGIAFTYANANVESDSANNQKTDIDSVQLSFYNHNFNKNNLGFYNEQIANVAFNMHNSTRFIEAISQQTSAKYNSMELGAQFTIGHNKKHHLND